MPPKDNSTCSLTHGSNGKKRSRSCSTSSLLLTPLPKHRQRLPHQNPAVPWCPAFPISSVPFLISFFFFSILASPSAYGSSLVGVASEQQLSAYTTATAMWQPSNIHATYTTAHSDAGSLTPRARPASSRILGSLVPTEPQRELLLMSSLLLCSKTKH